MKWKKIGPYKILARYGANAYKMDLPHDLGISPIFNVQDLVVFKGVVSSITIDVHEDVDPTTTPQVIKLEADKVLETRPTKGTRHKVYFEHLIKWNGKHD